MDIHAKWKFIFCAILCWWASFGWARVLLVHLDNAPSSSSSFNVMDFGAVGNGKTDDSKAFLEAWSKVCGTTSGSSSLTIPSGKTFLLNPLTFEGPCKSGSIGLQIKGNLVAPNNIFSAWKNTDEERWITFNGIYGLTVTGSGQIDGQGSTWWKCRNSGKCSSAPNAVMINNCNNLVMNNLEFVNSPGMHIVLNGCTGVQISKLKITAPEDSPNTDGIHVGSSQHVDISDSTIGTGDDCISIGNGSSDVNVTGIFCGPGHGISIGSLGASGSEAAVEHINIFSSNLSRTMNGARIKTWQGGSGFAREIKFENIQMDSVDNPIIIDQYYCNGGHNCGNHTSAVKVSEVSFIGVYGTSDSKQAINLACSKTVPCTGIHLEDIQLTKTAAGDPTYASCFGAHGSAGPHVYPPVPCLAS